MALNAWRHGLYATLDTQGRVALEELGQDPEERERIAESALVLKHNAALDRSIERKVRLMLRLKARLGAKKNKEQSQYAA